MKLPHTLKKIGLYLLGIVLTVAEILGTVVTVSLCFASVYGMLEYDGRNVVKVVLFIIYVSLAISVFDDGFNLARFYYKSVSTMAGEDLRASLIVHEVSTHMRLYISKLCLFVAVLSIIWVMTAGSPPPTETSEIVIIEVPTLLDITQIAAVIVDEAMTALLHALAELLTK